MKMMKRVLLYLTLICAAGTVGFVATHRSRSQPAYPHFTPFVAQFVERHFGSKDATQPGAVTYSTYARRSDGSSARAFMAESPDGQRAQFREFMDVASRKQVALEPFTSSISTYYLSPRQLDDAVAAEPACGETTAALEPDHPRILGYDVIRVDTEPAADTTERDPETTEKWVAPQLDCFPLRKTSALSSGPHNESEVTTVIEGEPPASMFETPAGYVERSPSQVAAAYAARFPGHKFMSDHAAELLDRSYYAHRQQ